MLSLPILCLTGTTPSRSSRPVLHMGRPSRLEAMGGISVVVISGDIAVPVQAILLRV